MDLNINNGGEYDTFSVSLYFHAHTIFYKKYIHDLQIERYIIMIKSVQLTNTTVIFKLINEKLFYTFTYYIQFT